MRAFVVLEAIVADYYTSFSVLLPVGAGNMEAALALYAQFEAELEANDETVGFVVEGNDPEDGIVWLWDGGGGSGDPEQVIAYACRCAVAFGLTGLWGFRWGLSCSRPRLDGCGGGAQVLDLGRRSSVDWVDTGHWLDEKLSAGEAGAVAAETILRPTTEAQGWNADSQAFVLRGFIDGLIAADPSVADCLRAHLAAMAEAERELFCRQCGKGMFLTESGVSHHVGPGLHRINYDLDRDHTAVAETEPETQAD